MFYANYLKFFERARTEWLRTLGFAQETLRAEPGVVFIVSRDDGALPAPARLDDLLVVTVDVRHAGQASMTIAQQAWRGARVLAEATSASAASMPELPAAPHPQRHSNPAAQPPSMNQDFSILTLVLHASFVVQLVMAGLMLVSLASWTVIFGKLFGLSSVRAGNEEFEREFWAGKNLNDLYADADRAHRRRADGAHLRLRHARVLEAARDAASPTPARCSTARAAPCARASSARWTRSSRNLSFLASVGSVSPYVGLFGTVWGIMHAFVGLSNMPQVTLATVAPGIAEALVATAIGLFAAIPAVIAYNRFARDIDRIAIQLETFIEEFSNILQRNAGAMPAPAPTRAPDRPTALTCPPSASAARAAAPSTRSTWCRSST